jgi:hypothetical protein
MEKTCRDLRRELESLREAFNSCSDPFDVVEIGCKIERIEKELEKEEKITTDIKYCARCGEDHGGLQFVRFKHPCGEFTHWAMCPKMQEPILLRRAESDVHIEEDKK